MPTLSKAVILLSPFLLLVSVPGMAQRLKVEDAYRVGDYELVKGTHYEELSTPIPTNVGPDKIEVTDVFWYGCPQCFAFEPMIGYWGNLAKGDLVFSRSPIVWNDITETHARIYYTAEALKIGNEIHEAAYSAIHEKGNPLRSEEQIRALFKLQGVTEEKFAQTWNSPSVSSAVEMARDRTENYELEKVPSVIVNGRYRVTLNEDVPTFRDMIIVVNLLIKKIRDVRRPD